MSERTAGQNLHEAITRGANKIFDWEKVEGKGRDQINVRVDNTCIPRRFLRRAGFNRRWTKPRRYKSPHRHVPSSRGERD